MFKSLEAQVIKQNFSGVIALEKDSKILYKQAFGFRNRSEQLENTPSTAFGIASGCKTFTALGILKLIEADRLTLDSKVFDIVQKPFEGYDGNITISHLLSHMSGLPDYFDEDLIEDFENFSLETPWHQLTKPSDYWIHMPKRPMKHQVNTQFNYNNSGYIFLAMVIETLSGDYHQWIKDQIIDPLALTNTGFYAFDALPANTALGYYEKASIWHSNIYKLPLVGSGDGGIYSSCEDLLRLWKALVNHDLLSEALTSAMLSPQAHVGDNEYYGYGIWLNKENGHYNPSMVGSDTGVSFISYKAQKKDITLVMISNTSDQVWDTLPLLRPLIDQL